MVDIIKAGDLAHSQVHIKGLLWGDSGAGKTYTAVTAPRPLVLLTEQNGIQSVRQSNPDAKVAVVNTIDGVREVLRMAMTDELGQKHGVRTLVVDSLTEIQRLFKDEILRSKGGKDASFALQDWGTLAEKMRGFLRTLRDVPYHVVATSLAQYDNDEASGKRYASPAFEGRKTPAEVAQYFAFVGYVFKRPDPDDEKGQRVLHRVMLDGPSHYTVKPCAPLGGIMQPNLTEWFEAIMLNNQPSSGDGEEKNDAS